MRFFFHYNKPKSRQEGKVQISLHFQGKCHIVEGLQCKVETWSRVKKRQPYFVIVGDAEEILIERDYAFIG